MKQNEDIMEINGDNCIHYDLIRFRNYAIMQLCKRYFFCIFHLICYKDTETKKNNYMADSPNFS